MKHLLVLCGGQSPEHLISLRSCKNILGAIGQEKYKISLIGISQEGKWVLMDPTSIPAKVPNGGDEVYLRFGSKDPFTVNGESLGGFDAVFPVLHGPNGEDGTIQGLLRLLGIPFVGCDVLSSAVSMDKDMSKRLLRDSGINVAKWLFYRKGEAIPTFDEISKNLSEVVFVKPSNMGSSVGVHRVSSQSEWEYAMSDAFKYDRKVLVEECVDGRELECAVLGNDQPKASGLGEVKSGDFYSYEEKYDSSSNAEVVIPAPLEEEIGARLKQIALASYKALDCRGLTRVDMFLTPEGEVYVNEVNTIPGFTSISMYPKLWEQEGLSYSDLIDSLIEFAIETK